MTIFEDLDFAGLIVTMHEYIAQQEIDLLESDLKPLNKPHKEEEETKEQTKEETIEETK